LPNNGNLIHSWPSDELVQRATLTLTDGTLDTGYALADLFNGAPSKGVRFTTDHLAIVFDHGSAVALEFPILVHTNVRSTATASFQRNATNSWGAPSVNVAFTLTNADQDGLRPNPWLDRRGDASYRYTRLVISGNGTPIVLGQLAFYQTLRQLAINISDAPTVTATMRTVVLETNAGIRLKTARGARQWSLQAKVTETDAAGLAVLQAWHRAAAGRANNFGVVWDPSVNDAWYAAFDDDAQPYVPTVMHDANTLSVHLIEVARGQVWP
jgi:hypothetical protein